jgi:MFS family permease
MIVLDISIVITALPTLRTALGFSATGLSRVQNAYTPAFGGLLLLGSRAGDLFGRRRMVVVGLALFTAASLAVGLASTTNSASSTTPTAGAPVFAAAGSGDLDGRDLFAHRIGAALTGSAVLLALALAVVVALIVRTHREGEVSEDAVHAAVGPGPRGDVHR